MFYQAYQVCPILRPYVHCIWTLEERSSPSSYIPEVERILPDGQMEMIFHLGDSFQKLENGKRVYQARSFLYGQLHQYLDLIPPVHTKIIAIRFLPFGLYPFVPISPKEFQQRQIELADLYGQAGKELEERVNEAGQTESAIKIIEDFLIRQLALFKSPDPLVLHITGMIMQSQGLGEIQDFIRSHKISPRHFQRRFLEITGTKSKTLSRILRVQRALRLVQQHPTFNLREIGFAAGYFDQAHFVRDFKGIAGMSPGQFFRHQHELNEQFVGS